MKTPAERVADRDDAAQAERIGNGSHAVFEPEPAATHTRTVPAEIKGDHPVLPGQRADRRSLQPVYSHDVRVKHSTRRLVT